MLIVPLLVQLVLVLLALVIPQPLQAIAKLQQFKNTIYCLPNKGYANFLTNE